MNETKEYGEVNRGFENGYHWILKKSVGWTVKVQRPEDKYPQIHVSDDLYYIRSVCKRNYGIHPAPAI